MSGAQHDVIVIGGGVNGLTCAAYLAKSGLKTLLLEAGPTTGGGAATSEIAPGFSAPTLSHAAGPMRRDVIDDLQLASHGLTFIQGDADITILGSDAPLVLWHDERRTRDGLRSCSPHDADAWPEFQRSRAALGRVVGSLFAATPPSVDVISGRDLLTLIKTLRAFRALEKSDAYRLLRWGPMAVADVVAECFESEPLRAGLAADGILGANLGPWSAGSGLLLLLRAANDQLGAQGRFAKGGPGAIAKAIQAAAEAAGTEIRTRAEVVRLIVQNERVRGVVLPDGASIEARAVVSAVDPKRTFLQLCDPMDLAPEFLWRIRNYRTHGTLAKLNLALSALPEFKGVIKDALTGRVRIAPDVDYLERAFDEAKYGRYSSEPFVELTIPTLLDPTLAPHGAHILSAYIQFAPIALRGQSWEDARDALASTAVDTIERHAPGLRRTIVAQQTITPLDLERDFGLTGGHIFHGELALDQLLSMRPLLGWGRYRTPIAQLYLCGSGTHPGTGLTGGSGANAAREIIKDLR